VHLSAIANIFRETLPADLGKKGEPALPYTLTRGPFAGFEAPFACPDANAGHMHRNMIDTYLITHPHLDHISGFIVNTAGLPGSRAKRLAGLPSTIAAFKTHIFNNIIWPNLSDENNGAGLVTYMRLVEGGSPAVGNGEGRGYLEITDDLGVKVWGVSHGHCVERHSHRGSSTSTRFGSMDGPGMSTAGTPVSLVPPNIPGGSFSVPGPVRPVHHSSATRVPSAVLQQQQQRDQQLLANAQGVLAGSSAPSGPGGRHSSISQQPQESICVYDSSAYFIRDMTSGREILIFGDVEPDSISLSPRNQQIWQEAAPKIASGKLAAIFIECSYDDSQPVDRLFGHLAPRFIVQEMANLAEEVRFARERLQQELQDPSSSSSPATDPATELKKRKRDLEDSTLLTRRKAAQVRTSMPSPLTYTEEPISPRTVLRPSKDYLSLVTNAPHTTTPASAPHLDGPRTPRGGPTQEREQTPYPLKGLKVVIIHVKDKMTDGPKTGEIILKELKSYEADTKLGCEFLISRAGESMYL
jgi:3',5'-cyclic-nucleotide phosphodiesterase